MVALDPGRAEVEDIALDPDKRRHFMESAEATFGTAEAEAAVRRLLRSGRTEKAPPTRLSLGRGRISTAGST